MADIEIIVKYNGDIGYIGQDLDASVEILNENYAIITTDKDKISKLQAYPQIEYYELPKILSQDLIQSTNAACITSVKTSTSYNLSGEGVIIAIIDSGIDYTHSDFRNEDGTSRILYIWDQSVQSDNPPAGFKKGTEYTKEQFDEALKHNNSFNIIPQIDNQGHGTAVCGVAAGNGREAKGTQVGVAPLASIIGVKLGEYGLARTTELMRAIKYVTDKAINLNMPISINISFGTNEGSHDGRSLFESYVNSSTEKWKTVISVAAGNEGGSGHHYSGKILSHESQSIDLFLGTYLSSFSINILKNFSDDFTVEISLPDGNKTGIINYDNISGRIIRDNTEIIYDYGQPSHYDVNQNIVFQLTSLDGFLSIGVWRITIRASEITYGFFDIWIPSIERVTKETAFSTADNNGTIAIPATCEKVISVGGYDSRVDTIAAFSGRGMTRGITRFKPDIIAPAVNVTAPKVGGGYGVYSGTSIASPFVAGSAALMMEWGIVKGNDAFLYNQRAKAFLTKGALRNPGMDFPNNVWGYGTLCLKKSMDYLTKYDQYKF